MTAEAAVKEAIEFEKPCPFCGKEDGVAEEMRRDELDPSKIWWSTMCLNCGAEGPAAGNSQEARKRWNQREPALSFSGAAERAVEAWTIKPLEWHEGKSVMNGTEYAEIRAQTIFGYLQLHERTDGSGWNLYRTDMLIDTFRVSAEEAKEKAFDYYKGRLMAALAPPATQE